jgi:sensor histidine kinase YesM
MNPHFIFNTLGAIQSFMYNNDGKKAAFYLGRFSTLMRKILINSREEFITISEEEETIKSFLELHQLRLGFKFRIDCGDVDKNSLLLPPMLVQPFIENSVKHGIAELGEKGKISVSFQENKGWLNIQVEDNGVGIDTNKTNRNQTHTSYAISIFKERQQLLSKVYREQIDFLIQDKSTIEPGGSGVVVKVRLPVKI